MNGMHPGRREWGHRGQCAVCVPPGDKRSVYLPRCTEAQAACRGLYYAPAHNYSATTPLVCGADLTLPLNISVTRGDDWGCPSNNDLQDKDVLDSEGLRERAQKGWAKEARSV